MKEIVIPNMGEDIEEATISFWHVEPGDRVNEGDDLVELVTEKTTFNVPAPSSGVIAELRALEGEALGVGAIIAMIQEEE